MWSYLFSLKKFKKFRIFFCKLPRDRISEFYKFQKHKFQKTREKNITKELSKNPHIASCNLPMGSIRDYANHGETILKPIKMKSSGVQNIAHEIKSS